MPSQFLSVLSPRAVRRSIANRLERWLPPLGQYAPLAVTLGLYLLLSALLRVVLWLRFDPTADTSVGHLAVILGTGIVNDFVEALYLLIPFTMVLVLLPRRWVRSRVFRAVLALGFFVLLFGMMYVMLAEYFFFEEFNARFNLVAVNYLIYPTEVFTNIWDSYPVVPAMIAVAVLSAAVLLALWPWLLRRWERAWPVRRRLAALAAHAALLGLAIAVFQTDTLAMLHNRIDNEVAANGISSFFHAFRTMRLNYDLRYRTGEPKHMYDVLATELTRHGGHMLQPQQQLLTRGFAPNPQGLGKLNVVVLVQESLSAEFLGAYGNPGGMSPQIDTLAPQGLQFMHVYATGTRTVRGLEAISASFPPIPTESIVKRPGSEGIANWGEVMRKHGYESLFLYGGYGYFDNMNHYFGSNGFRVLDRTDIKEQTFANIWGVADEDLFRFAVKTFDAVHESGKPFFSMIMSTSNHKPFTFPKGIPGVAAEGGGRAAGVRYADYAIGRFFEMARQRPWFDDTLVVIVADHGARVYGADQIPMHSYRIPLLMISPKHLKPGKIETVTSQLDVAPTVLGLLGLGYEAPFYGQNVLALNGKTHPVLLNHNFDVGLMENGTMVVLGYGKTVHTYHFDVNSGEFRDAPPDPSLIDLTTAYYQTAYEAFAQRRYH